MMLDEEVVVPQRNNRRKAKACCTQLKSADEATYMDEVASGWQQGIAHKLLPLILKSVNLHVDRTTKTYGEMVTYSLPAMYEYYCVPKIDRSAFLWPNNRWKSRAARW